MQAAPSPHSPDSTPPATHHDHVTIMQGQAYVGTGKPEIVTTILGSCIACCLYDPVARIGGMNHFLLAEPAPDSGVVADANYGAYLMELLINQMMTSGALKSRMKAHIYGGADMHRGMTQIGSANARFARQFLATENIPLVRSDTGGECARRVDFDPVRGRVRVRIVGRRDVPVERPSAPRPASGEVELF
ncbi:MAG: chemotaxis protein CheD [Sphingobium sp.]|nr:chemotaxis protein CheD [Sphingobium sp.]